LRRTAAWLRRAEARARARRALRGRPRLRWRRSTPKRGQAGAARQREERTRARCPRRRGPAAVERARRGQALAAEGHSGFMARLVRNLEPWLVEPPAEEDWLVWRTRCM
ncbi:unnamed protein product, partial [Urochloa humidicola]